MPQHTLDVREVTERELQKFSREELLAFALRIRKLATIDELTGISNRRFFEGQVQEHLLRAFREKTKNEGEEHGAFLMIDIDLFKKVNDTYGHDAGDKVLHSFAQVLRSSLRVGDLFARYGGEEFVVFLPRIGKKTAQVTAERIREAVENKPIYVGDDTDRNIISVTVSVGIALVDDFGFNLKSLREYADRALYKAKGDGRNCSILALRGFGEQRRFTSGGDRRRD
ncbi:GGDEF domain-containing protein [Candidatus Kaiserbacteria bacterium]|nr:GGDEF domain-containing protein [Candidatus Kaiserbacteria bacterium]